MELSHVPLLSRAIRSSIDHVRLQQVLRRVMVSVLVLNAHKQRELVIGPEMEFERRQPGPAPVIHPLRIFAIVAARLPVALEHGPAAIVKGRELCGGKRCGTRTTEHRDHRNAFPGRTQPHHQPSMRQQCKDAACASVRTVMMVGFMKRLLFLLFIVALGGCRQSAAPPAAQSEKPVAGVTPAPAASASASASTPAPAATPSASTSAAAPALPA